MLRGTMIAGEKLTRQRWVETAAARTRTLARLPRDGIAQPDWCGAKLCSSSKTKRTPNSRTVNSKTSKTPWPNCIAARYCLGTRRQMSRLAPVGGHVVAVTNWWSTTNQRPLGESCRGDRSSTSAPKVCVGTLDRVIVRLGPSRHRHNVYANGCFVATLPVSPGPDPAPDRRSPTVGRAERAPRASWNFGRAFLSVGG